ncbi:ribonuclease H-like domain-containing protein [Tanacetum coccineum]
MAINDTPPPPPPPPVNMEKPFGVTNIKSHVPLVLDLDQLNYDAWCELFTSHCHSFGVHGLLDGTFVSTSDNAAEWKKLDSLVKVRIYGTISTSLLQTVLKKNVSAKDVWMSLQDLFHDIKEARAMELHEELRSMELGSMSIFKYFKKIKVAFDLLSNIDSPIDNKNLVMYIVNGLGDKYEHMASIIRYNKPSPTLLETRSMLLLEESRLNMKQNQGQPCDNTSSSTVLMAAGNNNNNSKGTHNKQLSGPSTFSQSQFRATSNQSRNAMRPGPTSGSNGQAFGPTGNILGPTPNQPVSSAYGPLGLRPGASHDYWEYSPSGNVYLDQPTAIPHPFNATTLRYADNNEDSGWYMDTGATSHLSSDANNLTTIFNKRINTIIVVGNGATIPVTNSRHSILPSLHRHLYLHNVLDYRTLRLLLRCESTGDLYPFHTSTTTPTTLLSSTQSTWHQRLGHPNDDLIHQLDVKNAFLHGYLTETVYMHQPPGFIDPMHPDHVCLLRRSLYGLKQVPRAWFQRFMSYAVRVGFHFSKTDSSLFIFRRGIDTAYLLLYVDDIILTASSTTFLQRIISSLYGEFAMTDLGPLNYFRGVAATRTSDDIFLSQIKYATEILERSHILNCNLYRTLIDTEKKLGHEGSPLCLYMHDPREPHLHAMKRVLCYLRGTTDLGLQLFQSSTSQLTAYSDADWAGFPATCCSTSGYCVFFGDNLLTWSLKRQETLSRSSVKAEYRGVTNAVAETSWIRNLLRELHTSLSTATLVYCDNVSAVYMSANPVQHQRTNHIDIDIQFVRDKVAAGLVRVLHKKLGPEGSPVANPTLYRSIARALQYLTFTRPDLSYAVQQLCLYMHDPHKPHLHAMKRVLCYLRGTTDLVAETLSRSSAEDDYRGVANAMAETSWICNLLCELHTSLSTATLVYCDNVSAIYMSANPVKNPLYQTQGHL